MEGATHCIIQYNHREEYKWTELPHEEQTGILVIEYLDEMLEVVTNVCYHPVAIFKIKPKP